MDNLTVFLHRAWKDSGPSVWGLPDRAVGFYKKMGFAEVGKSWENVEGTSLGIMILEKLL